MSRVYLEKAGFIRSQEDDFNDDGTNFYCYRAGKHMRVRVSKATHQGSYYIAARITDGALEYEEYSKISCFKELDALNCGSTNVSQEDVEKLFRVCEQYEEEYEKLEAQIVWPTKEEIAEKRRRIRMKRICELAEVESMCTIDKLLSLEDNQYRWFKSYYKALRSKADPPGTDENYAKSIYKSRYSRYFVKDMSDLEDSYDFKNCIEYLTRK